MSACEKKKLKKNLKNGYGMTKFFPLFFILMLFLVFLKASSTVLTNDFQFHYNHSIGNYENFDLAHSKENYEARPPMVAWISQPAIKLGLPGFWWFWFLLCFALFPLILYKLSGSNPFALTWFWAFPFAYEFWFSGIFAQLLTTILFLFQVGILSSPGFSFKEKYLSLGIILIVGTLTHKSFFPLWVLTTIVFLVYSKFHKTFLFQGKRLSLALVSFFLLATDKFLYVFTFFSNITSFFFLFVKNNGFQFYLAIVLIIVAHFVDLRITSFAFVLLFLNAIEFFKTQIADNPHLKKISYIVQGIVFVIVFVEFFFVNTKL